MFDLEDLLFWLRQCLLVAFLLACCVAFGTLAVLFMYAGDDTLSVLLWLALFVPVFAGFEAARQLVNHHRARA